MADTETVTQFEKLARKFEEKAEIDPGATDRDTTLTSKIRRIVNAIDDYTGAVESHSLDTHSDVTLAANPVLADFLRFDGSVWANAPIVLGDLPAIGLDDLSDVNTGSEISRDLLQWDGFKWSNRTITDCGLLDQDGSIALTGNWAAGSYDISAQAFEVLATANHRIDDDGLDNLILRNTNADKDITVSVYNSFDSLQHDLVKIKGDYPGVVIEPTGGAVTELGGNGILDVQGTWSAPSVFGMVNFAPTVAGGQSLGFWIRPTYDSAGIQGGAVRWTPYFGAGISTGTFTAFEHKRGTDVSSGQTQRIELLKEDYTRFLSGEVKTFEYTGCKLGGTGYLDTSGATITDTMLDLTGGAFASGGATYTQYGLKLTGFDASTGATVYPIYSDGGTLAWAADNAKIAMGAEEDVEIYYDGINFNIDTNTVIASNLTINCGTDKTVELGETVWDDFVVPATAIRLGGANPADEVAYKNGLVISFDSASDEYIYFVIQLPHRYKEGTDVKLHLHWTIPTSGSGGGAENVKWDSTYSASSPVTPEESWPAASTGTTTVDVQNDSADDHLFDTIATLTGTNYKISEVIICSLKRDTSVANNYSDEVYLVSTDVHYEVNTIGSRQELVK